MTSSTVFFHLKSVTRSVITFITSHKESFVYNLFVGAQMWFLPRVVRAFITVESQSQMNIFYMDPEMNPLFSFKVTLFTGISYAIVLRINVHPPVIPGFECWWTVRAGFQTFLVFLLKVAPQAENIFGFEIAPPTMLFFKLVALLKVVHQVIPVICFEITNVTNTWLCAFCSFFFALPKDLSIAVSLVSARVGHLFVQSHDATVLLCYTIWKWYKENMSPAGILAFPDPGKVPLRLFCI